MKKSILIMSAISVFTINSHATTEFCFDATAKATVEAVKNTVGEGAENLYIQVDGIRQGLWINGNYGPYNGVSFDTRVASGLVRVGNFFQGTRTQKGFTVNVDFKEGTCETLGTKVEMEEESFLK